MTCSCFCCQGRGCFATFVGSFSVSRPNQCLATTCTQMFPVSCAKNPAYGGSISAKYSSSSGMDPQGSSIVSTLIGLFFFLLFIFVLYKIYECVCCCSTQSNYAPIPSHHHHHHEDHPAPAYPSAPPSYPGPNPQPGYTHQPPPAPGYGCQHPPPPAPGYGYQHPPPPVNNYYPQPNTGYSGAAVGAGVAGGLLGGILLDHALHNNTGHHHQDSGYGHSTTHAVHNETVQSFQTPYGVETQTYTYNDDGYGNIDTCDTDNF
ncbi:hypothetical protein BC833DRAFT_611389 [Globomyces pollinis-pini]|nr:hypothetical protein BC833DRAFT_611389 [Globomyces pollinis-pini]